MNNEALGPTVEAVVKSSERLTSISTDEVREMVLHVDEPSFRYAVGQSVGLVVPGPHPFGNPYHLRRYSIAKDNGADADGGASFTILVKRCFYVDEVSGERYPGIASNYLCDAKPGDKITLNGPFKSAFKIPQDKTTNILMIGTGTGIAPFRAFIQNIYREKGAWQGEVRLFYGAKSGMDLLYMNDENNDIGNYYDEATFKAFKGLVDRPLAKDADGLHHSIEENAQEIWDLVQKPNTHVFLSGLKDVKKVFERKMAEIAGSKENWEALKAQLSSEGRLSELLYD